MQIVVTLSEEDYNLLVNVNDDKLPSMNARRHLHEQLKIGIILPKGHGRLIDADKTLRNAEEIYNASSVKDIITSEQMYATRKTLTGAPTIIEADKGG